MPVPLDDCFDRAESSRCDGRNLTSSLRSTAPARATGISWKDVRAGKLFATAKLDPRSGPGLVTATVTSPIPQNAAWLRSTDEVAFGGWQLRGSLSSRRDAWNSGASDLVPKDVLHHRVSGSLEAERPIRFLSAGVVFLDVESQADHIG